MAQFPGLEISEQAESVCEKQIIKIPKNTKYFGGSFWLCELVPNLQNAVTFFRLHTGKRTNLH